MIYESVAETELRVDGYGVGLRERETSSGFKRTTTVVSLHGEGKTGRGEDVTYESEDHYALEEAEESGSSFPVTGRFTLDSFSDRLSEIDLFRGDEPDQPVFRSYRRWAFESAALDLALKQEGTDLASCLGRAYDPVRFVVSTRLGEPPTGDRVLEWLELDPSLEFKLDPTSEWDAETVDKLSSTDSVRILDLKGQYHGTDVDQPADAGMYELVLEGFPDALIEDPDLSKEVRSLFDGDRSRVSWDYPVRSAESIEKLPWEPDWINIKPSRFGSVQSLFGCIEYCTENSISMYGGGQFELSVGREHLHALASVFYPDSPNDVAPRGYNDPEPSDELPSSPLTPRAESRGIEWSYS